MQYLHCHTTHIIEIVSFAVLAASIQDHWMFWRTMFGHTFKNVKYLQSFITYMNLNCIIEIQCFLGGGGTPLLCHLTGYGFQGLASNLLSPNNDQHQISPHHISVL